MTAKARIAALRILYSLLCRDLHHLQVDWGNASAGAFRGRPLQSGADPVRGFR